MSNTSVGARQSATATPDLGPMPTWNLGDLYPAPDSKEFERGHHGCGNAPDPHLGAAGDDVVDRLRAPRNPDLVLDSLDDVGGRQSGLCPCGSRAGEAGNGKPGRCLQEVSARNVHGGTNLPYRLSPFGPLLRLSW